MDYQRGFGQNQEVIKGNGSVTVIQIRNKEGNRNGTMTIYEILSGISVAYNDYHIDRIKSEFLPSGELFCVDYCREGRIEQEISPGIFRYVGVGDIRLDNRQNHATNFYFPLSHYHGITIMFEIKKAEKSIHSIMPDFPINIDEICNRYCGTESCSYLRNDEYVEHIFNELYNIPGNEKKHFMILKVMELLLYIGGLKKEKITEPISYYVKSQTDKVKAIEKLISSDLQRHCTLEELAEKFNISTTGMKKTFKAIYGKPIYTYLQELRMQRAAELLLNGEMSITEIAGEVGYESPSKFSVAFKKTMNLTPLEFRKKG